MQTFKCSATLSSSSNVKVEKFSGLLELCSETGSFCLKGHELYNGNIRRFVSVAGSNSGVVSIRLSDEKELALQFEDQNSMETFIIELRNSFDSAFPFHEIACGRENVSCYGLPLYTNFDAVTFKIFTKSFKRKLQTFSKCYGFAKTYSAYCDMFGTSVREDILWFSENVWPLQRKTCLDLTDFSGLQMKEIEPIIWAMTGNPFFTGLKLNQRNIPFIGAFISLFKYSYNLKEVTVSGSKEFWKEFSSSIKETHASSFALNFVDTSDEKVVCPIISNLLALNNGIRFLKMESLPKKAIASFGSIFDVQTGSKCFETLCNIDISNNSLNSDAVLAISQFLSTPNHIACLNLNDCSISNLEIVFGALLRGCTLHLRELEISGNHIQAETTSLTSFLKACSSIESLNLSKTKIGGQVLKSILKALADNDACKSLKLNLSCNDFSARDCGIVIEELNYINVALSLSISENSFEGDGCINALLAVLSQKKNLHELYLKGVLNKAISRNNLELDVLAKIISKDDLVRLDISNNDLKNLMRTLPDNIQTLSVRYLDISGNSCGDDGILALCKLGSKTRNSIEINCLNNKTTPLSAFYATSVKKKCKNQFTLILENEHQAMQQKIDDKQNCNIDHVKILLSQLESAIADFKEGSALNQFVSSAYQAIGNIEQWQSFGDESLKQFLQNTQGLLQNTMRMIDMSSGEKWDSIATDIVKFFDEICSETIPKDLCLGSIDMRHDFVDDFLDHMNTESLSLLGNFIQDLIDALYFKVRDTLDQLIVQKLSEEIVVSQQSPNETEEPRVIVSPPRKPSEPNFSQMSPTAVKPLAHAVKSRPKRAKAKNQNDIEETTEASSDVNTSSDITAKMSTDISQPRNAESPVQSPKLSFKDTLNAFLSANPDQKSTEKPEVKIEEETAIQRSASSESCSADSVSSGSSGEGGKSRFSQRLGSIFKKKETTEAVETVLKSAPQSPEIRAKQVDIPISPAEKNEVIPPPQREDEPVATVTAEQPSEPPKVAKIGVRLPFSSSVHSELKNLMELKANPRVKSLDNLRELADDRKSDDSLLESPVEKAPATALKQSNFDNKSSANSHVNWLTAQSQKHEIPFPADKSLSEYISDGVSILRLTESMCGSTFPKYKKNAILSVHKIDNFNVYLSFLKSSGVVGVGDLQAEDLVKGDSKKISILLDALQRTYPLE